MRRRAHFEISEDGRWLEGALEYERSRGDGSVERFRFPHRSRILSPADDRRLFERAGLDVETSVDYGAGPEDGASPVLCFVGRRTVPG